MDFVVETGEGLADAISYITGEFVIEWAVAIGATIPSGDPRASAARASMWLDANFSRRYPGTPKRGRGQGLYFPVTDGVDALGREIPDDEVPVEVMRAAAAAALRDMAASGSLAPDIAAGGALKSERNEVGSLKEAREYAVADGARALGPLFPEIEGLLSTLIKPRGWTVPLVRA